MTLLDLHRTLSVRLKGRNSTAAFTATESYRDSQMNIQRQADRQTEYQRDRDRLAYIQRIRERDRQKQPYGQEETETDKDMRTKDREINFGRSRALSLVITI